MQRRWGGRVAGPRRFSYKPAGSAVLRGQRFGMIVFGSRVDVVLPKDRVRVRVRPGERVWAGATTLAEVLP